MAHASISIGHRDTPHAVVLTTSDGLRFITLRCGDGVSLSLPAYDVVAVAYARGIAATLIKAADEIDKALISERLARDPVADGPRAQEPRLMAALLEGSTL